MFNYHKKFIIFIFNALFLAAAIDVFAMLPPKYLSIKDFSQCLESKNMGTWSSWCMPDTKPSQCPDKSWQQLNALSDKEKIPNC